MVLPFYVSFNQVASGEKLPFKPEGCNCSHILKALEHTTGLPNLQPRTPPPPPPVPGPLQAPVTHKPNGSVEKDKYVHIYIPKRGENGRDQQEPLHYNRIRNATLSEKRTHCNHLGRQRTY